MKWKLWIPTICVLLLLPFMVHGVTGQDRNALNQKNTTDKVMVLNFGWDSSSSADLIAPRAAWMLRKKLGRGDFDLPEIKDRIYNETRVVWANRNILRKYFESEEIKWLIGGDIHDLARDSDGEWQGPRLFGVAGIPIKGEIKVELFNCETGEEVSIKPIAIKGHVHRLRVFGAGSSPFPETPAAIDALIHDAIINMADEILDQINPNSQ